MKMPYSRMLARLMLKEGKEGELEIDQWYSHASLRGGERGL